MIFSLVCVNGVVPPELTFARLVAAITDRTVRLHDLMGYREILPSGYDVQTEITALDAAVGEAAATPDPAGRRQDSTAVHLLGYSAGASVTLAFAAARPHRVASLTLTEPPWVGTSDRTDFQAGMDEVMLHTPPDQRWAVFHRLLTRPGADVPPPPPNPPPWAAGRVARGEHVWRALRAHPIGAEQLAEVRAPVYLPVAADSHPWFTDAAHRLAAQFPNATVEIYPGNHVRPPHVSGGRRFIAALRALWASAGDTSAHGARLH